MKYFKVPLYHTAIIVMPPKDYVKKFPNNWHDGTMAQVYSFEGDIYMCFDPKFLTPGIIAHECLHAAMLIFCDKEIDVTPQHDEHLAYLLEFIYQNVYDIMYPKKGSKK